MKIISIKNLDTHAVIKWRITDNCNYKCPYCIRRPIRDIEQDIDKCKRALPFIKKLAKGLRKNSGKFVKIDLIGGEVTCLPDLKELIDNLAEESAIRKVNITTNFFRDADYFEKLADSDIDISLTASYHPTECSETLEQFIEKASKVKDLFCNFKIETVYTDGCTHTEKLVQLCEEKGIQYQVEENLFDTSLKGHNCSSTKKKPRYEVETDEWKREFITRNSFLKEFGIDGMMIDTTDKRCSRGYDYLYIEQDTVQDCNGSFDIATYRLYDRPHICFRSGTDNHVCTLCGNMSIS